MKVERVERYRVPAEVNYLLYKWGRANLDQTRHLNYPKKSIPCGDFREQGYKEESLTYNREDYEKLCLVIDKLLSRPEQRVLECHYRHRLPVRVSAKEFKVTKQDFLNYQERVQKRVVFLMDQKEK